jgi:uncharacterized protein YdiU (UPF0061 family)
MTQSNLPIGIVPPDGGFAFDHSYARLPERFWRPVRPTPVAAPSLLELNLELAETLGLDARWLASSPGIATLSGNRVPAGALPIAMAYAGHQFGHFVPQLGDGRAILLGEHIDPSGGRRDIQLKGAGPTPFSRNGDGRAAMGPVLREYLVSEAMHALAIPTTRALAAVATGEPVMREGLLPGALLVRVAASHVRVGTFQFFAARGDVEGLRLLAEHVVARHYPTLAAHDRPALALLDAVAGRQAALVARWLEIGFIHGVMNTDNMTVSGETIDYGPCAFLDAYHPDTVLSAIDRHGRYAFGNQAAMAQWNLARLAECLLPLIADDGDAALAAASAALESVPARLQACWLAGMRAKLGLSAADSSDSDAAEDSVLVQGFLDLLQAAGADYTLSFRALAAAVEGDEGALADQVPMPERLQPWLATWRLRLARDSGDPAARATRMRAANPAVIARNHLVQAALAAAVDHGDLGPFRALLAALRRPFDDDQGNAAFMRPPLDSERVTRTFCGT